MVVPTDRAITSWKRRRTMAANNFRLVVGKVDSLIDGNLDPAVQDIEQLLCELEVKFTTYEKAHDKIVGNATDEQMAREDYGNIIAVEHEDLLKKLEDSDQKLKLKKKALDRAAENADREDLRNQRAQEALTIRNGRIQNLRNTLADLKQRQEQAMTFLVPRPTALKPTLNCVLSTWVSQACVNA